MIVKPWEEDKRGDTLFLSHESFKTETASLKVKLKARIIETVESTGDTNMERTVD
jgi:hypothetical protein